MDKSWGVSGTTSAAANNADHRVLDRVKARTDRAAERATALAGRQEERLAKREADRRANEQARVQRREQEQQLAAANPHAAAAQHHRGSGRRDLVRQERDTSGYTMVVDPERIRRLAGRGATVSGLAAVLGISEEEVQRALAS